MSSNRQQHDRARAYRDALGEFPTGVALATAPTRDGWVVMTINSFTSLSLEPALIGWSVDRASDRFAPFIEAPNFGISVLDHSQHSLALHYARTGRITDEAAWQDDGRVATRKDALASFSCQVRDRVDVGDHVLLVGEVYHWIRSDAANSPLVFSRGRFTAPSQSA